MVAAVALDKSACKDPLGSRYADVVPAESVMAPDVECMAVFPSSVSSVVLLNRLALNPPPGVYSTGADVPNGSSRASPFCGHGSADVK